VSRKSNNLKKRFQIFTEQRVGFYTELKKREVLAENKEAAARKADKELAAHAALVITTPRRRYERDPNEWVIPIILSPREFQYAMYQRPGDPVNVVDYANHIAYDAAQKIAKVIIDHITKERII
jgi:hypothetical protein